MSLQIAVAHTGQRLDADPVAFSSVDALKFWISRATEIPPESQILLTPQGKHVKLQALLTEVLQYSFCTLQGMLTRLFTRKRYSSTPASFQMQPRLPYHLHLFQMPSNPTTRQIPSLTIPIYEHGKPSSKPAATGHSASSRNRTPCRA